MNETGVSTIKVLWTGGWDSTFRILSLADKHVHVEPYYLVTDRESKDVEIATMQRIREQIMARSSTLFTLAPLTLIDESSLHSDAQITQAFKSLLKRTFIGQQYEVLALLAKQHQGLELCIHRDDKAFKLIESVGETDEFDDLVGKNVQLNRQNSPQDLVTVFGDFRFPILDFTKLEMKAYAEQHGFIDLMNETWFCFTPIQGKSCGLCNPCKYTIEEGMAYRFTDKALHRYKYRQILLFPKRVYRKLKRTLKGK